MIVTVVVVMCKLLIVPPTIMPDGDCTDEEARVEEIVTDSDQDETLNFISCMMSQPQVANWKEHHPLYHSNMWRIGRVKCVPGRYEIQGRA